MMLVGLLLILGFGMLWLSRHAVRDDGAGKGPE